MDREPVESSAQKKNTNPLYLNLHTNVESLSDDCSPVTKLVRQKYFQHLQKTLLENKNILFKENEGIVMTEKDFTNIAQQIELKALNASMVADLYRKEMLNQIKSIKDKVDKYTTYEEATTFSLSPIHDIYKCRSNKSEIINNVDMSSPNISMIMDNYCTMSMQDEPEKIDQDDIFKQMKEIFGAEANSTLEDMIFGDPETPTALENKRKSYLAVKGKTKISNNLPRKQNGKSNFQNLKTKKNFWRLEEYVQTAMFQQRLITISDLNPRKYNKVMRRIDAIFGNVEMEILTPIDIEVLRFACKDRISHYVVNCLMTFYKKEMIKSRFLFKELSRALVQKISQHDPYIDGALIWKSVKDVFQKEQFVLAKQRELSIATNKVLKTIRYLS